MQNVLNALWIETPIGPMIAAAKDEKISLLEFAEGDFVQERERVSQQTGYAVIPLSTPSLSSLEKELDLYFRDRLAVFRTPLLFLFGTPFQKRVWEELAKIPYGSTCSYAELAAAIGKPTAYRAVAQANGANPIAIVIPCHRVINSDGKLGGYASGIARKERLLAHETRN